MDVTIPAPSGGTESAASQVTTQPQEQPNEPRVETPAGTPQAERPAGDEQTASGEPPSQDEEHKTWKEKRAERNRQRWQEYKAAKDVIPARLHVLERELASLRQAREPDFSQISDPTEEIAERAAWKLQQQNAQEKARAVESERQVAALEQQDRMLAAWDEIKQDARERMPDFDSVVNDSTPIHPRFAPLLVENEKAAEIAYWLGKNPAAARDLYIKFEAAPAKALIELGRIEARLSAPEPKRVSTAPRPASVLNGGINPLTADPSKMSQREYEKWRSGA